MSEILAYCGLFCHTCPIYLATQEEDTEKKTQIRTEVAELCNKQYKTKYKPEDIGDCDGCGTKDGRLFKGCQQCDIRKCAEAKGIKNCAYCDTYPCQKLEKIFSEEQNAKKRLDDIKAKL